MMTMVCVSTEGASGRRERKRRDDDTGKIRIFIVCVCFPSTKGAKNKMKKKTLKIWDSAPLVGVDTHNIRLWVVDNILNSIRCDAITYSEGE